MPAIRNTFYHQSLFCPDDIMTEKSIGVLENKDFFAADISYTYEVKVNMKNILRIDSESKYEDMKNKYKSLKEISNDYEGVYFVGKLYEKIKQIKIGRFSTNIAGVYMFNPQKTIRSIKLIGTPKEKHPACATT
jgi:hypothetical protein